jgi:uncharacterized membrane protein
MTGWLLFAFSGPVLWAISVHLDKYLIERFFKQTSVAVLLVFTALMGVLVLPVIWWFRSGVLSLPALDALVVGFSGILLMGALWFYLQALQSEEASVVAPLFQAAPLFGYLLGYFVLGETLSAVQTIGGLLIIGGALLLSIQPSSRRTRFNGRLIALMLVCTFALALTSLIFKVFAIRDEFWTTTFWTFVGEGVFGAAILAVPRYRRIFVGLLHTNPIAVLSINGANELMNLTGSLGARYALLLAPISLVQAIGSTTSLFVFLFGVAITVFLPRLGSEDLSRANLARKLCAAVVVMIGVILINR